MLRFNPTPIPLQPQGVQYRQNFAALQMRQRNVKFKFTPEEDERLKMLVMRHGTNSWNIVSQFMGNRNPRQCRERWKNYVDPDLRSDPWTPEEDDLLLKKYRELGPRWNKIAKYFVRRSDNSLRNRWQLMLRKHNRMKQQMPKIDLGGGATSIEEPPPVPEKDKEKEEDKTPMLMSDLQNLLNKRPPK